MNHNARFDPYRSKHLALLVFIVGTFVSNAASAELSAWPNGISDVDRSEINSAWIDLSARIPAGDAGADAAVFAKSAEWALRYERQLAASDVAVVKKMLQRCGERIDAMEKSIRPWGFRTGSVIRGFQSAVDGSIQPYGVIIPAQYDKSRRWRLDVVLHGSLTTNGLNELRWVQQFDAGDNGGGGPDQEYLELHPLGRVENGYRWAGETDIFEAIAAACREYSIDPDRIVIRGMSMGGSGTWHLGLKHPDRFAALGPYAGYVETEKFSRLPFSHFVPVGPLPDYQASGLHMLDSVDYAANIEMVPTVAGIGENDAAFEQHAIMAREAERLGAHFVNRIAAGKGHELDSQSFREQMQSLQPIVSAGRNKSPKRIRFVTWTLKYSRCHWIEIVGLVRHYDRAEIVATTDDEQNISVQSADNVARLAFSPPALSKPGSRLTVLGVDVELPDDRAAPVVIERSANRWTIAKTPTRGKRAGLQGPIDDAFTGSFLCVRGTGTPCHPAIHAWATARLAQFQADWPRYFRGDLPVKDDTDVTPEDLAGKNLILFGDAESNSWIAKVLPHLPIVWNRSDLRVGGRAYSAEHHAPVLIQPNPLPGGSGRYVVFNSGHTFGAKELASVNYLLFPRLGDWAVIDVTATNPIPSETPVTAGFFDEHWGFAQ